eukprot:TRINITY_DN15344_c0_g1_i15.p1 TRINITY_DN15344_c0_g1~~TRINITY_DN15344_c0_g1_i15.p1  ORF type:complete len:330 (+),score=51.07 TRINITY_DN15344_c0_g1_i15:283-1272(+)
MKLHEELSMVLGFVVWPCKGSLKCDRELPNFRVESTTIEESLGKRCSRLFQVTSLDTLRQTLLVVRRKLNPQMLKQMTLRLFSTTFMGFIHWPGQAYFNKLKSKALKSWTDAQLKKYLNKDLATTRFTDLICRVYPYGKECSKADYEALTKAAARSTDVARDGSASNSVLQDIANALEFKFRSRFQAGALECKIWASWVTAKIPQAQVQNYLDTVEMPPIEIISYFKVNTERADCDAHTLEGFAADGNLAMVSILEIQDDLVSLLNEVSNWRIRGEELENRLQALHRACSSKIRPLQTVIARTGVRLFTAELAEQVRRNNAPDTDHAVL